MVELVLTARVNVKVLLEENTVKILDKQPSVPLTLSAKIMAFVFPEPPSLFQRRVIVQALCLLDLSVRLKPLLAFQTPVRIMPNVLTLELTLSLVRVVAQGTRREW